MIRIVGLPHRNVVAQRALLEQRFGGSLRVDAAMGRAEAARSQDALRHMGHTELARLRDDAVSDVVWFEVRAAEDWVGALLWPRVEELALMHSPTDGAWTLAEAVAECLEGHLEEA